MATFIGKYNARLDDKGRVVFPSPLKGVMPAGGDMRFIIKRSIYDGCLEMYTFDEWVRQSEKIKEGLDFFNPDHVSFWREYMMDRDVVEPDPRFGRISISRELLDAIGVDREVIFLGIDFKIEIWAKEKFETARISNDEFIAIAKGLSRK